jgi:isopentenyldiphosphate isomerase
MDELLDIVNDEDVVTGQVMRSKVHELGLQHRGVHVFLFTPDGRLLIQKRSKDRAAFPSAWDCSVSEHIKAGESYDDAAIRGMKEELGIGKIEVQPVVKFKMNYGPNDNEISMVYRGEVDPAMVRFDPVEIEKVDCPGLDELQNLIENSGEVVCGWFVQMIRWSQGKDSELQVLRVYSSAPLFRDQEPHQNGPQG